MCFAMNHLPTHPQPIEHRDHWIQHPEGRLFARQWLPAENARRKAAIVMLHDSLGCTGLWREFPAQLCRATGRPVIAYDRLGFGHSDPRHGRPPLGFVAQEAAHYFPALRDQLGIERGFVALGHSVGGGMAVHCAANAPGSCVALITIAAQAFVEDRTLRSIREAKDLFADPAQVERLARYHGDKTPWVLDAWIGTWLHPDFAAWSLADVLPQVRCPVLAIHGELDEYGSARHPEMIGELCAGPSSVALLEGVAHVPHRERPEQVLALVAGFLGSVA
jgi:pimeloyl-ACP methyl ester carboxylesterase